MACLKFDCFLFFFNSRIFFFLLFIYETYMTEWVLRNILTWSKLTWFLMPQNKWPPKLSQYHFYEYSFWIPERQYELYTHFHIQTQTCTHTYWHTHKYATHTFTFTHQICYLQLTLTHIQMTWLPLMWSCWLIIILLPPPTHILTYTYSQTQIWW